MALVSGCVYIYTAWIRSSQPQTDTSSRIFGEESWLSIQFRKDAVTESDYQIDGVTAGSATPHPELPQSTMDRIKKFAFFIGHPHSGHSIVGAIIDSHPHIVLAHEADIFLKIQQWRDCNKSKLFNTIWKTAFMGNSLQKQSRKGYTLTIDNLYQGTYQDYIDVIGDKKGGSTAALLYHFPEKWGKVYHKLQTIVALPMKVFHVIRNPYDNIASLALARHSSNSDNNFGELRVSNETNTINPHLIDKVMANYFGLFQVMETAKRNYSLDVLEVHSSDLVADPKNTIRKLFKFLRVPISDELLDVCSKKVFPEESKLRYKIEWEEQHIQMIKKQIQKFPDLKRYSEFDS